MDSTGLMWWIAKFISKYPDTEYNFVVYEDNKLRSFCIDANEHHTEFKQASEILRELEE